jgi:glycosyltransferase involved in cell wall biosynthesis
MKILFVLENHYPNIGGVETLFKNLTEALAENNIEVTVVTTQFDKKLLREETINNVKIIRLPFYNRYIFTFLAFIPLISYARKHDIIHTTSYNAGVPAFLAGLLTRTQTIITFHEVWGKLWFKLPYMNKLSLSLHYTFEKFLLALPFSHYIAVSDSTKNALIEAGIPESKIKKIYNGIDYSKFKSVSKEDNKAKTNEGHTFTYFGRLGISKGLDILLNGIRLLYESDHSFKINLVIPKTPVDFHDRILQEIDEYNITPIITVHSHLPIEELHNIIRESDTIIIPSYSEGFCFSAVEAMALDVPIIHSGKGSLKEVVSAKNIMMQDLSAEALMDAMIRAIHDDWDTSPLRKFPLNESVNLYLDFYKNLIKAS